MNVLDDLAEVEAIVASARAAQLRFEANGSQVRYDRAAQAAAWAIMEPSETLILLSWPCKQLALATCLTK